MRLRNAFTIRTNHGHIDIPVFVHGHLACELEARSFPPGHELTGGRNLLNTVVGRVDDEQIALKVHSQACRVVEPPRLSSGPSPRCE